LGLFGFSTEDIRQDSKGISFALHPYSTQYETYRGFLADTVTKDFAMEVNKYVKENGRSIDPVEVALWKSSHRARLALMESKNSTYFSSHDIRSSAATMDRISGQPDEQVAAHCGHTNKESVKPYLKHLNDNKLSISIDQVFMN
jgi:integrase